MRFVQQADVDALDNFYAYGWFQCELNYFASYMLRLGDFVTSIHINLFFSFKNLAFIDIYDIKLCADCN